MVAPSVRAARPADVSFLADAMYESMLPGVGHGIFDASLEGTEVRPLDFHEALLRCGANNWGQLDSFIVIEDEDGRLLGTMGGFRSDMSDLRPLTVDGLAAVSAQLGWSTETARTFWLRYVSVFGMFGKAPQLAQPGEYVLEYAAMRPESRGRGLYGLLLRAHVERASSWGIKRLGGTAMIGNDAVLRSLLKFGFREHSRFGADYYKGIFPGLIRLVYDL